MSQKLTLVHLIYIGAYKVSIVKNTPIITI